MALRYEFVVGECWSYCDREKSQGKVTWHAVTWKGRPIDAFDEKGNKDRGDQHHNNLFAKPAPKKRSESLGSNWLLTSRMFVQEPSALEHIESNASGSIPRL